MSMNGEIIVNFSDKNAFLTEDFVLTLQQLNLPEMAQRFHAPAHWKCRIVRFNRDTKTLSLEVISYHTGKAAFAANQKQVINTFDGIESVRFISLDTAGLIKSLQHPGLHKTTANNHLKNAVISCPDQVFEGKFTTHFNNIRFSFGCIYVEHLFEQLHKPIEVCVENLFIRTEFEAVKHYFAKALSSDQLTIHYRLTLRAGELFTIEAWSEEINRINETLIDSVKFEFIKSSRRKITALTDVNILTAEEYMEILQKHHGANPFNDTEDSLFENLLQISDARHFHYLRYLSKKHAHHIMKLRFVLKPFSFIFLIEGEKQYHVIWETLDSEEATYVWHVQHDIVSLKRTIARIEDIIQTIAVQGRIAYISNTEDPFRRIFHEYTIGMEGFMRWKSELEQFLY